MEGIVWLFLAFLVALMTVGVVVGLRRRPDGVSLKSRHCLSFRTPMSLRRVSWFKSLLFMPAWECRHCGNRSRFGKGMAGTAS